MICPFCNANIPARVEAAIDWADACCPSGCDGEIAVSAACPTCGRVFWRKLIDASYAAEPFIAALGVACPEPAGREYIDAEVRFPTIVAHDDGVTFTARVH